MNRTLLAIILLVASWLAVPLSAEAQPFGRCGNENLPPPLPLNSRCHWACVTEPVGPARPDRPQQMRQTWKKICPRAPSGSAPGGKAEIKKKNVPQVKPNKGPAD